jgi:hypothetical protein
MIKATRLATVVVSFLILAVPAAASHKPHALHCKHGYVADTVTVKEHKHGRTIKIRKAECVKVKKAPAFHWVTGTPGPTAAPTPTPEPSPKPRSMPLEVVMTIWDPINVVNPEYTTPQAGYRFIAVELSLTNVSAATISSDANVDATVMGTNGQSYMFALGVERKRCTDFGYGDFTLSPGAHAVGCVVYELPEGVQVAKAQWGLNGEVETTRAF